MKVLEKKISWKNYKVKKQWIAQVNNEGMRMREGLKVEVLTNADVLIKELKSIKDGMETYRQHRNMTWLKGKIQKLIDDLNY